MQNEGKNWFLRRINAYFVFTALIVFLGAYFILMDNWGGYEAKISILLLPKNEKTAIQIDKIRENIVILAKNSDIMDKELTFNIEEKNTLIELKLRGDNQLKTLETINSSARNLINTAGKYYDLKNDLNLEIVFRKVLREQINEFILIISSLIIGLVSSFIIQVILDSVENTMRDDKKNTGNNDEPIVKRDLKDVFKANREKIEKLSASFAGGVKKEDERDKILEKNLVFKNQEISSEDIVYPTEEVVVNFKKAASPANLPIDQGDFDNIYKENILNNSNVANVEENSAVNIKEEVDIVTEEPTEEDFKRRLNQLLGNKIDV